jgi:hypothetical protein
MNENNKLNNFLSSIEEIVDEARNGRMFVLVDNEDRENEGDLIIPAQMATPDAINFMATHGRGLICLSLTKNRIDKLKLSPMGRRNPGKLDTALFQLNLLKMLRLEFQLQIELKLFRWLLIKAQDLRILELLVMFFR